MEGQQNEPTSYLDGGNSAVGSDGSGGLALSAATRLELARYTHKASVVLAYSVAVLAVVFDFWAQVNGKPYQLHDWIVGLILIPLGGAGMEIFREWLKSSKRRK